MANKDLHAAKVNKNDEFYTQMQDIAKELRHYKDHFRDKVVFCNCDDPYESNFFKYFALQFNALGLRKLIATCYDGSPIMGNELLLHFDIDEEEISKPKKVAYKVEITEVRDLNGDGAVDLSDVQYLLQNDKNVMQPLQGNGDFRSPECIELLKQADIVVTNPPFSLFREYISQLFKYNKKFLIIGNTNAITYKDIFAFIKENRLWLGCTNFNVGMYFYVPDSFEKYHHEENGKKIARVSTSCWYTNLEHQRRHEPLIIFKRYNAEEYPVYDNYDAIEVSKVADIPVDYQGVMGVPITFLDKFCPEQFEIVELGIVGSCTFTCNKQMEILDKNGNSTGKYTYNAKGTLYRAYNPDRDKAPAFRDVKTGELYSSIYARILIRRKQ